MAYIFCFGDSNTYGYDARSMFGERLPEALALWRSRAPAFAAVAGVVTGMLVVYG